jgi:NhaP-type Na+/H+ or K+/H+ antiporter
MLMIMVINAKVPHGEFIALVVVCTVIMSLVAHCISANPLATWLGNRECQV